MQALLLDVKAQLSLRMIASLWLWHTFLYQLALHMNPLLMTWSWSSKLQFGPQGLRCGSVNALGQQCCKCIPLVCMMTLPLSPSPVSVSCGTSQPLPRSWCCWQPSRTHYEMVIWRCQVSDHTTTVAGCGVTGHPERILGQQRCGALLQLFSGPHCHHSSYWHKFASAASEAGVGPCLQVSCLTPFSLSLLCLMCCCLVAGIKAVTCDFFTPCVFAWQLVAAAIPSAGR